MKKHFATIISVGCLLCACTAGGTKDSKNEGEHYPTTDTTKKAETINSPKDTGNATDNRRPD